MYQNSTPIPASPTLHEKISRRDLILKVAQKLNQVGWLTFEHFAECLTKEEETYFLGEYTRDFPTDNKMPTYNDIRGK